MTIQELYNVLEKAIDSDKLNTESEVMTDKLQDIEGAHPYTVCGMYCLLFEIDE